MHPIIIIMCKAPVAGAVKTRLTTRYSPEQAAELHAAMAATVINRARRLFEHVIIAADQPDHPFFQSFACPIWQQGEGDLGDRMQRLMQAAFTQGADTCLCLGTDSPHMPDSRLLQAIEQLKAYDVVLGPVEDGGYDLIAMSKPWQLFDDVIWSSAAVLTKTLANIDALGLTAKTLDVSFDVDEPEDVERAVKNGWGFI